MAKVVAPVPARIALVNSDGTPTVFGLQILNNFAAALNGKITAGGQTVAAIGGFALISGAGSPVGVVTALPGTLYVNTDGGAGATLYVKQTGTDASGWAAK